MAASLAFDGPVMVAQPMAQAKIRSTPQKSPGWQEGAELLVGQAYDLS
ncbi:MAG: hypothetical protein U5L98_03500 [Halomonas sp.]|nr:hypothetical protein [Halomonas sp.]MDZ7851729.1 hypothetical protein [Halomonas sp.]